MEEITLTFPEELKDKRSRWDNYVPIIKQDDKIIIYLTDIIEAPATYNETSHTIEFTEAKEVIFKLNNGGGVLDSYLMLRESIKRSKAKVIADISGTVASAATMIALECDDIIIADHTAWMSHFYSGATQGKGNEIMAQNKFIDKEMPKIFKEVHKGFFTTNEINKMINGTDFWLNKEQVLERWKKREELRNENK